MLNLEAGKISLDFLGNDMIPATVLGHMVDFWVEHADLNVNFITTVKAYGFLQGLNDYG